MPGHSPGSALVEQEDSPVRQFHLLGLPGWLDASERFDVEGWRWRSGQADESLPKAVELEKKFNLARFEHGPLDFHGARAAGTL